MSKKTFYLRNEDIKANACRFISTLPIDQEKPFKLVIGEEDKKTREQEEMYHAQIGDIAKQYRHGGRQWGEEDMKRLLIDAFHHDTKGDEDLAAEWKKYGGMTLAPAIGREGFVALGIQSRKFTRKLGSAFIEWLNAFAAENDVEFKRVAFCGFEEGK